jgi:signal transduction histidine kinase
MLVIIKKKTIVRHLFFYLFFVLANLIPVDSFSQYIRRSFSDADGLVETNIACLYLEENGFLLVGTNSGLYRYNGRDFKKMTNLDSDEPEITRTSHFYLNDKKLFIRDQVNSFEIKGDFVQMSDIKTGDLTNQKNETGITDAFKKKIDKIRKKSDPHILKIVFPDEAKDKAYVFSNNSYFINNDSIYSIFPIDNIYYSTIPIILNDQVFIRRKIYENYCLRLDNESVVPNERWELVDERGTILNISEEFTHKFYTNGSDYIVCKSGIFKPFEVRNGKIKCQTILDSNDVKGLNIRTVAVSRDFKTIYVGTENLGLFVFIKNSISVYAHPNQDKQYVRYFCVSNAYISVNNAYYIRRNQSLTFIDAKDFFFHFRINTNKYLKYSDKHLIFHDSLMNVIRKIPHFSYPQFLALTATYHPSEDMLYLYALNGIFKIDKDYHSTKFIDWSYDDAFDLPNHTYYENDTIWATSLTNSLYTINLKSKKIFNYPEFYDKSPRFVTRLDDLPGVFVCTYGLGIYQVIGRNVKKIHLPLDELNYAHQLVADDFGKIWIPTNRGLYVMLYDDFKKIVKDPSFQPVILKISKEHGLLSEEFNGGYAESHFYDRENQQLYFASMKGVVKLNVKNFFESTPFYQPQLISFKINQQEVKEKLSSGVDFDQFVAEAVIPLSAGNYFNEIEYRIYPYDTVWKTTKNGTIISSRPSSGVYEIQLRYRTGFGENDWIKSIYPLNVLPRWYERIVFRIMFLLLVILMLVLIFFIGYRIQDNRQKNLKRLIDKQTDDIRTQLTEVKKLYSQQELLMGILAHDIKSPLISLEKYMESLMVSYAEEEAVEDIDTHLQLMHKTIKRQNNFISSFLAWVKLRLKNAAPEKMYFTTEDLLQEITSFVVDTEMIRKNTISYTVQPENKSILLDKYLLKIVLLNLIDNACKNSVKGMIKIEAEISDHDIIIKCIDNGRGMDESTRQFILTGKRGNIETHFQSTRLGYVFIRDLCNYMLGKIDIESELGKGTTVTLTFPLGLTM